MIRGKLSYVSRTCWVYASGQSVKTEEHLVLPLLLKPSFQFLIQSVSDQKRIKSNGNKKEKGKEKKKEGSVYDHVHETTRCKLPRAEKRNQRRFSFPGHTCRACWSTTDGSITLKRMRSSCVEFKCKGK